MIVQDGLRRMIAEQEDVYLLHHDRMNENYAHPAMPEGAEEGILRGMYLLRDASRRQAARCSAAARLGRDPARGDRRRPSCSTRTSASPPTCGA